MHNELWCKHILVPAHKHSHGSQRQLYDQTIYEIRMHCMQFDESTCTRLS